MSEKTLERVYLIGLTSNQAKLIRNCLERPMKAEEIDPISATRKLFKTKEPPSLVFLRQDKARSTSITGFLRRYKIPYILVKDGEIDIESILASIDGVCVGCLESRYFSEGYIRSLLNKIVRNRRGSSNFNKAPVA